MRQPKTEPVRLPYASSVASYFGDRGAAIGSSFLSRAVASAARDTANQSFTATNSPTNSQQMLFTRK